MSWVGGCLGWWRVLVGGELVVGVRVCPWCVWAVGHGRVRVPVPGLAESVHTLVACVRRRRLHVFVGEVGVLAGGGEFAAGWGVLMVVVWRWGIGVGVCGWFGAAALVEAGAGGRGWSGGSGWLGCR